MSEARDTAVLVSQVSVTWGRVSQFGEILPWSFCLRCGMRPCTECAGAEHEVETREDVASLVWPPSGKEGVKPRGRKRIAESPGRIGKHKCFSEVLCKGRKHQKLKMECVCLSSCVYRIVLVQGNDKYCASGVLLYVHFFSLKWNYERLTV